jgi:acetyl-CoA hydrolase
MNASLNSPAGKRISLAEAARLVPARSRIYLGGGAGFPQEIERALVARAASLEQVEVVHVLTFAGGEYLRREYAPRFRHRALFIGAPARNAVNEGRADYVPIFLSEIPALFRDGELPLDIAFIQVSPPDEHGFCSYGVEVGVTKPAAESAGLVIAEINQQMPRVLGDAFIHMSDIDYLVDVDYALPEIAVKQITPEQNRIGEIVAELIPDGATLQLGIGALPNAVLSKLGDKRDLGIHSELFSDGVVDLVEQGVVTNAAKTLHQGKIVAGFLFGSQRLYRFVNDNPMIELHPTDYVNDPFIIAQNHRMTAINSAIEVDLSGQVCADSVGGTYYSGIGGQLDFIRGAARSKGGKAIVALPSLARGGISRIVPRLREGAGVVTTRGDVHYVVTEYGVASLHGKSVRERTRELIAIAHPQFRDELSYFAKQQGW